MAATSVPGVHGWSNPYHLALPGVLRLSPSSGRGLRAPFLFGGVVAGHVGLCAANIGPSPALFASPTCIVRKPLHLTLAFLPCLSGGMGLFDLTPSLSRATEPPPSVTIATDKPIYRRGEPNGSCLCSITQGTPCGKKGDAL